MGKPLLGPFFAGSSTLENKPVVDNALPVKSTSKTNFSFEWSS
jgi:hypothetical protein